jgi:pterin-4a-carbinolamine dehydratase
MTNSVNTFVHRSFILSCLLGCTFAVSAAGSSVANKTVKIYQKLIVEGERPEISACLTSALQSRNPNYDKIAWSASMSDQAVVNEYTMSGSFVKEVSLKATGLVHDERIFRLDNWVPIRITCLQIDEQAPVVTVKKDI